MGTTFTMYVYIQCGGVITVLCKEHPEKREIKKKRGGGRDEDNVTKDHIYKTEKLVHSIFFSPFRLPQQTTKCNNTMRESAPPLCTVSPFKKKCTITDMVVPGEREQCVGIRGTANT